MNCKIGVDGGATKTECILVDETGAVAARHLAKGCSPSHLGPEEAGKALKQALSAVFGVAEAARLSKPGERRGAKRLRVPLYVTGTLLCMAGNRDFWREFAQSLTGFGRVVTVDDSFPILELATAGQPGLVLHGGTGSFVAARTEHERPGDFGGTHYAGGLGWRFGDQGSGYDLGRRAIARALLEMQGWMSPSGISQLVAAHTGLKEPGPISRHFYSGRTGAGTESDIASLAPGILRLASERDATAHSLVVESVSPLLDLAVRVATKLFPNRPIRSVRAGLSGPILTTPIVVRILTDRSPIPLDAIKEPPIEGVRRLLDNL